ncbi:MAG: 3-deoxy-manno-octulosonate cytidylyltransferase [Chlamydiia bacterium]|nr:3-deoxy-manno-octulosonate cytidylyltransferase [Chlamydiia bacterium]
MSKRKVIAVIPARYASTRFPGKALATIAGKSLLQRTFENARAAALFDEICVATDDKRIFKHAEELGALALMTPSECPTGTDRVFAALQDQEIAPDTIIINLQGDVPLLEKGVMEAVIAAMLDSPLEVMATAAVKIKNEEEALLPSIVKCVLDKSSHALYFSRSLIPHSRYGGYNPDVTYYHHLGIYAFTYEFLKIYSALEPTPLQLTEDLEQLKAMEHGYKIKVAIVESSSFGVDRPEDVEKVERLLCQ